MINQILTLLFLLSSCANQKIHYGSYEKLSLKSVHSIKQLETSDTKRFDMSGFVEYKGNIYVIADKEWNNHIYKLDTTETGFNVASIKELCLKESFDIEGIDIIGDNFCLIDEIKNDFYEVEANSCEPKKISIAWEKYGIDRTGWGNKGFEGLAVDNENNVLYLAKEREPRNIFRVDLKTGEISEPFAAIINSDKVGYDIADLKYENGFLYVLERGLGLVTKINVKTNQKESLSFQHLVLKSGQRLYKNRSADFGMAEALMLTKDEIWVGLDNNGDQVTDYGKSLGLKGDKPVIFIFKRPQNF
jgi:hypothetical protein